MVIIFLSLKLFIYIFKKIIQTLPTKNKALYSPDVLFTSILFIFLFYYCIRIFSNFKQEPFFSTIYK